MDIAERTVMTWKISAEELGDPVVAFLLSTIHGSDYVHDVKSINWNTGLLRAVINARRSGQTVLNFVERGWIDLTGYSLEIGHLSGYGFKGTPDEAWAALAAAAEKLCDHPERIEAEAYAFGARSPSGGFTLTNFCERYRTREDLTISIDHAQHRVYQFASSEGDRATKEAVRRAFCRLLIADMHWKGIEIVLTVW